MEVFTNISSIQWISNEILILQLPSDYFIFHRIARLLSILWSSAASVGAVKITKKSFLVNIGIDSMRFIFLSRAPKCLHEHWAFNRYKRYLNVQSVMHSSTGGCYTLYVRYRHSQFDKWIVVQFQHEHAVLT